jgi:ATP-dependent helicase HrpB
LSRRPLPIDPLLPEIAVKLREAPNLVIEAPPGAGKTTRVPPALLEDFASAGELVVLQPRRLPARLAAMRVADELGEEVGQTAGYTVRFEDKSGPRTRIRFMTEGLLLRKLLAEPVLPGVSLVVLDEFHERHLATDLALALLARLQKTARPELRLVVMSATLDSAPVREFLGNCPQVRSEGRAFPVDIAHTSDDDERPLSDRITSEVRRLLQDDVQGDILVFLPGAGDIRRTAEALGPLAQAKDLLVLPLHGDLSPTEQKRAVTPASKRKVILSTNVAETSVTIEGVGVVIDSGLARIASHSPWSGLPKLAVAKISQASAIQRAGRAGRTGPGRAIRLYPRHDFDGRRPFEVPEIARLDLSEALLTLAALGIPDVHRFDWFEAPGAAALEASGALLRKLSAIDAQGTLTEIGRRMLAFPVHPRLARLLVEAERRQVGDEAAALAGILSEGDISDESRATFGGPGAHLRRVESADVLERLDRFSEARRARFDRARLRALAVDARAAESVEKARRQLAGLLGRDQRSSRMPRPNTPEAIDAALAMALLTAFPDRVMRRRSPGASQAVLASGGAAEVGPQPPDDLLVAVDAEEQAGRHSGTAGRRLVVRLAAGIQADWLLDLVPDGLSESEDLLWNSDSRRVETVARLSYGAVVLDETRRAASPSPEASRLLAEAALANDAASPGGMPPALANIQAKLELLRSAFPEQEVPMLDVNGMRAMVVTACDGLTSLEELAAVPLDDRLRQFLPTSVMALLRNETPDRAQLPGGRQVTIQYEAGKPPWIASRLQDFFGMKTGPSVCRGRVALTLHLLAPNQRAVQVTSDLAGFWTRHYPSIRRELCRRYPKHAWPEDGATATPPPPRARR